MTEYTAVCIDGPLKGQTVTVTDQMRVGTTIEWRAPVTPKFSLFIADAPPTPSIDFVTYRWEDDTYEHPITYDGVVTTVMLDRKVWRCGEDFRPAPVGAGT